jgi:predicted dehydrogenase
VDEAFGLSTVISDHEKLVTQPDVDVVAVTVKVPHHRELVSAALAAGKAIYCEWPLGRDLDEAQAMAALAAEQGVRTVVGSTGLVGRSFLAGRVSIRAAAFVEVVSGASGADVPFTRRRL